MKFVKGVIAFFVLTFLVRYVVLGLIFGVLIGTTGLLLSPLPGFKQAFIATGVVEDQTIFEAVPMTIQWAGMDTNAKTVTIRVTNRSTEAWQRFAILCPSNKRTFRLTDMSGILPNASETRTYALGLDGDVVSAMGKCRLDMHIRGKPSQYDSYAAHDYGNGGWGDRLPM